MNEDYWEHYGWWVNEWAYRLVEEAGEQGGEYRASLKAKAYAMVLHDMLRGFGQGDPKNKEGIRHQRDFWNEVYAELLERQFA